jgi:hypothetical protein
VRQKDNKPVSNESNKGFTNAFEVLYGKPLTGAQKAEMKFNLVNFIETLISMDRQHQEWLKQQTTDAAEGIDDKSKE